MGNQPHTPKTRAENMRVHNVISVSAKIQVTFQQHGKQENNCNKSVKNQPREIIKAMSELE